MDKCDVCKEEHEHASIVSCIELIQKRLEVLEAKIKETHDLASRAQLARPFGPLF